MIAILVEWMKWISSQGLIPGIFGSSHISSKNQNLKTKSETEGLELVETQFQKMSLVY